MSETFGLSLLLLGIDRLVSHDFAVARLHAIAACGVCLGLAVLARASLLFTLPFFVAAAILLQPAAGLTYSKGFALRRNGVRGLGLALRPDSHLHKLRRVQPTAQWPVRPDHSDLRHRELKLRAVIGAEISVHSAMLAETRAGAWSVVEQARERLAVIRAGLANPALSRRGTFVDLLRGWLRQLPSKSLATFRDLETTFDYGYYGERSEASALYLTCVSFGLLLSLAVLGTIAVVRAGQWHSLIPLLPVLFGIIVTTTMFHPSTRYRLPLAVALAPLAGAAVSLAIRLRREGRPSLVRGIVLLTVLFAGRTVTRQVTQPGLWELRVAESAAMASDFPECSRRLAAAFRLEPQSEQVHARAKYVLSLRPACESPNSRPRLRAKASELTTSLADAASKRRLPGEPPSLPHPQEVLRTPRRKRAREGGERPNRRGMCCPACSRRTEREKPRCISASGLL